MQLVIKKWKKIILSVCVLLMMMSVTVFAENSETPEGENLSARMSLINLEEFDIVLEENSYVYTGEEIKPAVSVEKTETNGDIVKLEQDTDYSVSYTDNVNVGTATVTVTGIGGYEGELTETFEINKASISAATVKLVYKSTTYNGSTKKPGVTAVVLNDRELVKDTDYSVAYSNNTKAGTATVTVTGLNNYKDTVKRTFTINRASISAATVTLGYKSTTYNGSAKTPSVASVVLNDKTLKKGSDYKVSYSNNVKAGTATVTVTGINNYKGTVKKTFVINKASISAAKVTLSYKNTTHNGSAKKPEVKSVVFNGKKLVKNSDYTVTYANNKNAGTATVTLNAKGNNFKGTKKISFTIKPENMKISLTRSYKKVKIDWEKETNVDGYMIYRSTSKDSGYKRIATVKSRNTTSYTATDLEYNEKYYFKVKAYKTVNDKTVFNALSPVKSIKVRVAKAEIEKIRRESSTELEITWKAVEGATGYRVYRSKTKDGEYNTVATLSGNDKVSFTDEDLKCGRTYYYKVKAFRLIDGTKYAGDLSDAKSKNTRPSQTEFTDDSYYKATKAILEWEKVSYADGYVIYRSNTKNGTYKLVKTIESQNTLNWTNNGLSKTEDYYYKIKAYCDVDGKRVYSAYSDIFHKRTGGWRYSTFQGEKIKYYYNADNERVDDVSNIIGKQSSYVIKVNKRRATVTIYAKDGDNGYIIPVKAMVCSPGWNTPEGTFYTPVKYRWKELMGPCWGQWSTRITGSFLFHSVFYNSYHNNDTLSVNGYNKLGTVCSHGCVRLTAGDAKWIYDNCKLGTKVIIYNSSVSGPLGKPSAAKLSYWHTWDPTDPNKFDKCDSYGCH